MDHWEAKLAAEGSALDEHERTAFALQFALATDAVAKRALVEHRFVPGSPDAVYFGALCVLLDIQALLEQQTLVGNEAAKRMLEEKAALLDGASTVLESKGCTRKLSRVRQRRMLLDLEAYHRQGSSSEHLKVSVVHWGIASCVLCSRYGIVRSGAGQPTGRDVRCRDQSEQLTGQPLGQRGEPPVHSRVRACPCLRPDSELV
jgi:hypothetical protein